MRELFAKLHGRIYKRLLITGGCYFFTVNLAERQGNDKLIRHIVNLRATFPQTRNSHPFSIDAIVILPEHLHCIWQLPAGDTDYPPLAAYQVTALHEYCHKRTYFR
jgi:putative transposase